jgi:hypothetical protein
VFISMVNALAWQASRAMSSPETEVGKDVCDLAVFGHGGTLDFTAIAATRVARTTHQRRAHVCHHVR